MEELGLRGRKGWPHCRQALRWWAGGRRVGGQVRVPSLDSVSVTVSLPSFIIIDSRNCCSAESGDAVSSRSPTRA
jgi:hypothetical protein